MQFNSYRKLLGEVVRGVGLKCHVINVPMILLVLGHQPEAVQLFMHYNYHQPKTPWPMVRVIGNCCP